MQTMSIPRRAQGGFTLIELIVVIVILGILAATALPKFADLGSDARAAKMAGARAAVVGAANLFHGRWLAAGSPITAQTYDGVTVNTSGYPTSDAAGILIAANLSSDYDVTGIATGVIKADSVATRATCAITYNATTGTVSNAPAASLCQ